jgi:hypothetical protein
VKCEIIDNKLVVVPGTPTETWAFNHWLESISSWESVCSRVALPEVTPAPEKAPDETDELDAIFGPKVTA